MDYILILIAYILGAIPFGLIITRLVAKTDIRQHGSGNIGATNVMRKLGPGIAVLVLLLDLGKGALVIYAAHHLEVSLPVLLLSGFAVVFGHCFPVFLGFKGGKGVATTLGVLLMIPGFIVPILTILLIFIVIVALTRYVSLGSVVAALLIPMAFFILSYTESFNFSSEHIIFGTGIAALVIILHRENIRKLLAGQESKIGAK